MALTIPVSLLDMNASHPSVKMTLSRRRFPGRPANGRIQRENREPQRPRTVAKPAVQSPRTEGPQDASFASSGEGAFILYLREIGQVPLLSAEEELTLARRIRKGDRVARDQMIQANLRLVVRIARDFEGFGLPLLDLISEGNIGLMTAVDRFDPSRGVRLCTYAALWIKQHMRRAIANHSRTIRVPVHVCEQLFQVNRVATRLQEILGHTPSPEELAAETGLTVAKVNQLRGAVLPTVSLDTNVGDEGEGRSYAETVADDRARPASEQLDDQDVQGVLGSSIGHLNAREQEVLRRRFGLEGAEPQTLDEVGAHFGLTRERIRQIQAAALKKLRGRLARTIRTF